MDMDRAADAVAGRLRTTTAWTDGVRVVTAVGVVDAGNNHRLHAALSLAIQPGQPLIADLSQATDFDVHGLYTLRMIQRNAELQDARLLIVPSPAVAALLALSAADGELTVYPDSHQAVTAAYAFTQADGRPAPA